MRARRPSSSSRLHRVHRQVLARAALAAALAALALPAPAAQGSLLEISVGPHETGWLRLAELQVLLDGAPLQVTLPTTAEPIEPVYSGVVAPGHHHLEVKSGFTGDSKAFSYVEGYVFRMQGELEVDAPAGEAVGVQARVVNVPGVTVEWTDRFRLTLQATAYRSARAAAAQLPDPEPQATATAPEPPVPAAVVPALAGETGSAAACTLEPPRFALARHALDAAGRASLDRFAACLAASADVVVVIEGFADPRGPDALNDRLAERRAQEAAGYLVRQGVAERRLTVRWYGASRLACTEPTEACNARNRRVEAVVEPSP